MKGAMRYKGFFGSVEYSAKDRLFHGKVEEVTDTILFEGECVDDLERDFHEAVDEYLALCKRLGKEPMKKYSGTFNVRVGPELHRKLAQEASRKKTTLNKVVAHGLAGAFARKAPARAAAQRSAKTVVIKKPAKGATKRTGKAGTRRTSLKAAG